MEGILGVAFHEIPYFANSSKSLHLFLCREENGKLCVLELNLNDVYLCITTYSSFCPLATFFLVVVLIPKLKNPYTTIVQVS